MTSAFASSAAGALIWELRLRAEEWHWPSLDPVGPVGRLPPGSRRLRGLGREALIERCATRRNALRMGRSYLKTAGWRHPYRFESCALRCTYAIPALGVSPESGPALDPTREVRTADDVLLHMAEEQERNGGRADLGGHVDLALIYVQGARAPILQPVGVCQRFELSRTGWCRANWRSRISDRDSDRPERFPTRRRATSRAAHDTGGAAT